MLEAALDRIVAKRTLALFRSQLKTKGQRNKCLA